MLTKDHLNTHKPQDTVEFHEAFIDANILYGKIRNTIHTAQQLVADKLAESYKAGGWRVETVRVEFPDSVCVFPVDHPDQKIGLYRMTVSA